MNTLDHLKAARKHVDEAIDIWSSKRLSASDTKRKVERAMRELQEADWLLQTRVGD